MVTVSAVVYIYNNIEATEIRQYFVHDRLYKAIILYIIKYYSPKPIGLFGILSEIFDYDSVRACNDQIMTAALPKLFESDENLIRTIRHVGPENSGVSIITKGTDIGNFLLITTKRRRFFFFTRFPRHIIRLLYEVPISLAYS